MADKIECAGVDFILSADDMAKHGTFLRNMIEPVISVLMAGVGRRDWKPGSASIALTPRDDGTTEVRIDVFPDDHHKRLLAHYLKTKGATWNAA